MPPNKRIVKASPASAVMTSATAQAAQAAEAPASLAEGPEAVAPIALLAGVAAGNATIRLASQEDYVTVVVTPKLTFQLCRRPEWQTIQDITQEELRSGFASRFPTSVCRSLEKFSFKPTLLPTSAITRETQSLVYKLVSDEVADERILLSILRELEKSYEGIIRRAVEETRSEALQEQFLQQEQAEEARKELEKQSKDLRKDNKSLRDQLQSIQKRLFLVEQEKDTLRKEQSQSAERLGQLERSQVKQAREARSEQESVREQMAMMQMALEGALAAGSIAAAARPIAPSAEPAQPDVELPATDRGVQTPPRAASAEPAGDSAREPQRARQPLPEPVVDAAARETDADHATAAAPAAAAAAALAAPAAESAHFGWGQHMQEARADVDAGTQTDAQEADEAPQWHSPREVDAGVAEVSRRVDGLQQQMGALRNWMLQGSHLFAMGSMMGPVGN